MKSYLLIAAMLLLTAIAPAQEPTPTPPPGIATEVTDKEQNKGLPTTVTTGPGLRVLKPSTDYVRPNAATRRKRFFNSTVGPLPLGRIVFNAGLGTWTNSPEEWGTKWEGFGRRVASNVGKNVIRQTTTFALDEALKLDSYFYRSKDRSVGARIKNSLLSPVTARNKNGKRVIGIPRIAGAYASDIIAKEAWFPERYDWKDGMASGTASLGFNAVFNLFREFVLKK